MPRSAFKIGIRVCARLALLGAVLAAPLAARAAPPDGDLIGAPGRHVVADGETLLEIARRYDLGFVELRAANPGVDPWVPPVGLALDLPTAHLLPEAPRRGLVLNMAEQRLYHFRRGGAVASYPLGTGKDGWPTPLGATTIVEKRTNPSWVPPASIRAERPDLPAVVPPGPANPLGAFALDLGWAAYTIHGTNRPYGIGRRVSHGCVRLYPEDIEALFAEVTVGTPVTVIDQPIKLGWHAGALYLEVHPTQAQADEIEATGRFTPAPIPDLQGRIVRAAGAAASRVDWPRVGEIARDRRGLPVRITRPDRPPNVASGYLRSD